MRANAASDGFAKTEDPDTLYSMGQRVCSDLTNPDVTAVEEAESYIRVGLTAADATELVTESLQLLCPPSG